MQGKESFRKLFTRLSEQINSAVSFRFPSCLESTKVDFSLPALEHVYRGIYVQVPRLPLQPVEIESTQPKLIALQTPLIHSVL